MLGHVLGQRLLLGRKRRRFSLRTRHLDVLCDGAGRCIVVIDVALERVLLAAACSQQNSDAQQQVSHRQPGLTNAFEEHAAELVKRSIEERTRRERF